jgi:hypothetical protein
MASWRAILANPDLDAAQAAAAIDRLLDDRLRRTTDPASAFGSPVPATGSTAPASGGPAVARADRPGSADPAGLRAQRATIMAVLEILLSPAGDIGGNTPAC